MIKVVFVYSFVPNLNNRRSCFVDKESFRKSAKAREKRA